MNCTFHTMHLKEIDRTAEITVCVPENASRDKRFPVLYMHDGQNIVDPKRSYSGSTWEVKESLETLDNMPEIIVVGISSASDSRRLDEYNPFVFEFEAERLKHESGKTPGGLGEAYMQDVIHSVKPFVDDNFPSETASGNTAMMGSSLGGLISLYAGIAHGDVFTRIASLSGAFFVSIESLDALIERSDLSKLKKVYIDTGDNEVAGGTPKDYVLSNQSVHSKLKRKLNQANLSYREIKDGEHHETDWAQRFPEAIRFLFD